MNWLNATVIINFAFALCAGAILGCGVKGDPLPPEKPPELGRGRPTYKRAAEDLVKKKGEPDSEHDNGDSDDDDKD